MGVEVDNEREAHDSAFVLLFWPYVLRTLASAMSKPMMMLLNAGTGSPTGRGRAMERTRTMASDFQRAGGSAKILEFRVAYSAKHQELHGGPRQSWSERAGVTDAERLLALTVGALITPAVWAGHSLLVWMHLL